MVLFLRNRCGISDYLLREPETEGEVRPQRGTQGGDAFGGHETARLLAGLPGVAAAERDQETRMIIVGVVLLVLAYVLPMPYPLGELMDVGGWILLVLGVVFLILGLLGRPVGGRRYWY
jgi:hypothetical protein